MVLCCCMFTCGIVLELLLTAMETFETDVFQVLMDHSVSQTCFCLCLLLLLVFDGFTDIAKKSSLHFFVEGPPILKKILFVIYVWLFVCFCFVSLGYF